MMENLTEIGGTLKHKYKIESDPFLWYVGDKSWTVLTKPDLLLYFGNFDEDDKRESVKCFVSDPVDLRYLTLYEMIVIISKTEVVMYNPAVRKHQNICEFSKMAIAAEWNPNESNVLIIDEDMVVHSYNLVADYLEYRFELAGSCSLFARVPNSVDDMLMDMSDGGGIADEGPPTISWRYNGEQFVVNYLNGTGRKLKVFDSSLQPLYESATYPNLLVPVSFKGDANLIAGAQCLANDVYKIGLFENNCLPKQEFIIEPCVGPAKQVKIHPHLSAIGVYCTDENNIDYFNLYMLSNGLWYLKQQHVYNEKKFLSFEWTDLFNSDICGINILTDQDATHYMYKQKFTIISDSNVAAVNGNKIYVTQLGEAFIPPPFSAKEVKFPMNINRIDQNTHLNLYFMTGSNGSYKSYALNGAEFKEIELDEERIKQMNEKLNRGPFVCTPEVSCMSHKIYVNDENCLIVDGAIVDENIKTLLVVDKYLVYVKSDWNLHCVRMSLDDIVAKWAEHTLYSRPVDPGSSIIGVTSEHEIALLVPRGNIEIIYCRVMTLDMIEKLLEKNDWKSAIFQIRQTKLNWNVLIDLNPKRFDAHIEDFLEAAHSVYLLNIILNQFTKTDYLASHYSHIVHPDILRNREENSVEKTQIFRKILQILVQNDPAVNIVNITTILHKHFSLKAALRAIYVVYKSGELEKTKLGLSYLSRNVTSFQLIQCAYGLYNKDFIRFILLYALNDPKVFQPELDNIVDTNEATQRFQMCLRGNFIQTATKYLIRSDMDINYMYEFINNHKMHKIAYTSLTEDNPHYLEISKFYANYLTENKRHDEAGEVYEKLKMYKEAVDEYGKGLNWRKFMELTREHVKMRKEDINLTLTQMAFRLTSNGLVDDSITLLVDHRVNIKQAVEIYYSLHMYRECLTLAYKHFNTRWTSIHILPSLNQYRKAGLAQLQNAEENFILYSNRLLALRQKKVQTALNILAGVPDAMSVEVDNDYDSIISLDYSTTSSSGRSRTTKQRRKEEKRKIDCREGSRYEDIALIRQCYIQALEILKIKKNEDNYLLSGITRAENRRFSIKFKARLVHALDVVTKTMPLIWNEEFLCENDAATAYDPAVNAVIGNREHLDDIYKVPPTFDDVVIVPPSLAEEDIIHIPNLSARMAETLENYDDFTITEDLTQSDVANLF